MRLAYADPPYPGMARRFYKDDPRCAEVDHAELVRQLDGGYDGWALSTASSTLQQVLAVCPAGVRIAAWCKPMVSFKSANPAYAWEPVIFKPARRVLTFPQPRDYHIEPMTMRRGLVGAKPESFCFWLFCILGARADDTLDDLYPGTGAVGRAWRTWQRQYIAQPLFREKSMKGARHRGQLDLFVS